jgi:hypothetical protein
VRPPVPIVSPASRLSGLIFFAYTALLYAGTKMWKHRNCRRICMYLAKNTEEFQHLSQVWGLGTACGLAMACAAHQISFFEP